MDLYLVRHGQTDWNREGRIQGWIDVGLNEKGRTQAGTVAAKLPSRSFDLYTSPLRRATETADRIARDVSLRARTQLDEFRELNQGYWNGLKGDWLLRNDLERYKQWINEPTTTEPPAGESLSWVRDRVQNGLRLIFEKAEGPVLVVAHKVVNSLILHLLEDRSFDAVLDTLPDNAQVKELSVSPESMTWYD